MEYKNGLEDLYILKDNKKLRYGYTTGSCAAAAAKAATLMLLCKTEVHYVDLMTPKGIRLNLKILDIIMEEDSVTCAVQKDSGDDPDVTNGIMVYAKVSKNEEGTVCIDGGIGVGRVTKAGLEQPKGNAAINRVPRQMITDAVMEVCDENDYASGINVEIIIPQGVEIAKRTFNPNLGIVGGISVLGTSGIVEPMSEAALIESIRVEMKMAVANGAEYLLLSPGNYGADFTKENLSIPNVQSIKFSNYVGEAIDIANELGVKGILFISHIGKFIKVAGGIMNTHSKYADARMEILAANAVLAGASIHTLEEILKCVTTDEALAILELSGITEKTMEHVVEKIKHYLNRRAYESMEIGAIIFSNEYGILGQTENAKELLRCLENCTE
ncbi:cobalt-precorrin-5B (C(1))-methyltransferase CbiD [Lachnoclostridium phytofermentans]|uniref:Cobalt-precorrin-5B C(1)-methyltransferase n=1 Tax=Lachnoclostridium phytofermentans (strain ATCC 700394 / DSM 18823 / ISDg) TaxID=357809 RepID=A9KP87_LACP7|nr:cobalt-precorrin-5B (C(1))-methyltransferase CbiD [Lachnoclostridium phytofermentans]ABX41749.1 cobalamin biosynthesis protein CbiD [Lachnoclostridium phytofermentans ISDg]